jgi:hypothetical protein
LQCIVDHQTGRSCFGFGAADFLAMMGLIVSVVQALGRIASYRVEEKQLQRELDHLKDPFE